MTPIERANRAQQLLDDEVLNDVFSGVRERLVARLEDSAFGDEKTHHDTAMMLQALKQLKVQLQLYAQELVMQKHKEQQEEQIRKARQRLTS
jgi:hypothetical protein